MKPAARLALLASLVLGITLSFGGAARADHEIGMDHPFCAQGGGQAGDSSGGPGGTIPPEGADTMTNDGPEVAKTVLVPEHLAERFGELSIDPDAQFIEIDSDDVSDDDSTGSNGSAFHGGHGGGPGGGQGGSTFFGGGDGGCSPVFEEVSQPPSPGRRLPVTGSLTQQLGLMSGLMLSLGWLLSLLGRRRNAIAAAAISDELPEVPAVRRGHEVVSRLKDQVARTWRVDGGSD
jgi:hypothetical protein